MARLEFFLACESVSIDQETNQSSVFNILEEIQSTAFPTVLPHCVAVSLWHQEPGDEDKEFQLLLRITLPTGETHDFRTNFQLKTPRHRVLQRFEGLPIQSAGELRFEARLNDEHAAYHMVTVKQVRQLDLAGTSQVESE